MNHSLLLAELNTYSLSCYTDVPETSCTASSVGEKRSVNFEMMVFSVVVSDVDNTRVHSGLEATNLVNENMASVGNY